MSATLPPPILLQLNSWGYMNRAGEIIAWTEANEQ